MQMVNTLQAVEPDRWNLVFSTKVATWWIPYVVPGRFKHVWALAHIASANCWLIYDVHLTGTQISLLPDCPDNRNHLNTLIKGCEIVSVKRQSGTGSHRIGLWCVTAIKHLLGLKTWAMRPDALYRYCLSTLPRSAATRIVVGNGPEESRTPAGHVADRS